MKDRRGVLLIFASSALVIAMVAAEVPALADNGNLVHERISAGDGTFTDADANLILHKNGSVSPSGQVTVDTGGPFGLSCTIEDIEQGHCEST
jgi:hypothetical protein